MGFFKKVFKKVKKGFKSIGKGIKSAFKKIGKFMGKIGIVGQLALMFTPVGAMMGNLFSGIGNAAGQAFRGVTGALAQGGKIAQAAGKVLEAGASFAKAGHSAFKTVTEGVSSFVSEFSKTALKKIPGMQTMMPSLEGASDTFFAGPNSAWSTVQNEVMTNATAVLDNFNKAIGKAPTVTTAAQQNLKLQAEKQVATANTGAAGSTKATTNTGPMKEGYKFPTDAPAAPEFGPLAENPSFSSPASGSMPQQTSLGSQSSSAINPITNKPYDLSNTMENYGLETAPPQKSLLGKVTDYASTKYKEFLDDRPLGQAITEESIDYLGEQVASMPDDIVGLGKQRLFQNIGLEAKPEAANVYYGAVAQFDTAPAGTYGSPEINDRAMQVQLAGTDFYNLAPFGAGANFYTQTMARGIGGTA